VVRGISTRDYEGVLDAVCDGYGVRRSSVSRHWVVASKRRLKELLERPLGELDLVAIMIDGIEFHEYVLIAALGIDSDGRKHVLGIRPGGSENAGVCTGLLEDLAARGLPTDREYLFVLDGSKALRKAVTGMFGKDATVQRCHRHKERNVQDHLPEQYRSAATMRLRVAWNMTNYDDAKKELTKALTYLEGVNSAAAESLREAFEDTLTIHKLGIPELLRKSLSSTNPIESCFSTTRDRCRNVRRWKTSDMAMRWAGTMLLETESRFHRVNGYRQLPILVSALRPAVDVKEVRA
jgi:putative transposase